MGDGLSLSVGTGGSGRAAARTLGPGRQFVPRHSPSLLNVGLGLFYMFWDGRLTDFGSGPFLTQPDSISLFGLPAGTQSTVSMGITRSTLNHPLFPTQGSRQSVNAAFTGGPLGGDGQFVKYTAEGVWWLPIGVMGGNEGGGGGTIFALGMTMRLGALQGDSTPFPFDGFWMGGVQFGQQVRGYDETTITPFGYFPEGPAIRDIDRLGHAFVSLTTEVAMRLGAQMSLSVFMDAGNVWRTAAEIDPTRMFKGAGVGVQLVTPFGLCIVVTLHQYCTLHFFLVVLSSICNLSETDSRHFVLLVLLLVDSLAVLYYSLS